MKRIATRKHDADANIWTLAVALSLEASARILCHFNNRVDMVLVPSANHFVALVI